MTGQNIGPFHIVGKLGEGGMGEVYRARDTRLKRDVALKILPASFAMDADRLARFQREAEVLASLNHPNIAAIYGLEEGPVPDFASGASSGKEAGRHMRALVMELVEGETLADRIARGPIPMDEALPIAKQITEALEAAHEQGITHRDLKPANIKVRPDGTVKVLDFGLAKLAESPGSSTSDASLSPTITSPAMMTGVGVLLGTAAYMSPEQAKGKSADKRSDIWAFGCVLYEMLTGRPSFPGDTIAEVLASVLKSDADLTLLPAHLNPKITELLRRCLAKDPKRRWHAAGDVRMEIEAILADPDGLTVRADLSAARGPLWKRAVPFAAIAVVAAALSAAVVWNVRPAPAASIARLSIVLPDGQLLTRSGRHNIAVSPDGQNIVYVANKQLYLRAMGDVEARPIRGTSQDVNTPFFSPDGLWIGFFSVDDGTLKKIATTGGAPVTITRIANPFGAMWDTDDRIIVGQGAQGIVRISANGGMPETIVNVRDGEQAHGPQMLPDGEHVLFTLAKGTAQVESRWDQAQIVVQSLRSGERTILINGGSDARYVPTGHIVYALGNDLLAVPFDERSLTVTRGPVPILGGVGRPAPANTGATYLSFSQSGALAYFVSDADIRAGRSLGTVDRKGVFAAMPTPRQAYADPRISPDGKQLAVSVASDTEAANIWIYDVIGALAPRRLTFGGANFSPAWMPDGRRVIFISNRDDNLNAIYWQAADGSGSAERLTDPKAVQPTQVRPSADGETVVYRDAKGDGDIWVLSLEGDRKPHAVISGPGNQSDASLSPDGRWMLYTSNETGRTGIFVQPFPPTGAKYQITKSSFNDPLWSPDGRQIFCIELLSEGGFRLAAVDVRTESGFTYANPTRLLDKMAVEVAPGVWPYDVTLDGRQFVVFGHTADSDPATEGREIRVTLNWFEELKRLVPTN
jgi:eukaryotic-like serine/threonine-protein kinase